MLCQINAHLGRTKELDNLLHEISNRSFFGSDEQLVGDARKGLKLMLAQPEKSFKCGPFAIDSILSKDKPRLVRTKLIEDAKSTSEGTNLSQVQELANKAGLHMQLAKRSGDAPLIVPSIMHWKLDHFGAITKKVGNHYEIQDPTFGSSGTMLASEKTLSAEGDGYFLVPSGKLPTGWTAIDAEAGSHVWGKGVALIFGTPFGHPSTPRVPGCGGAGGMAQASMWYPINTLNITDTPLGYESPLGAVNFSLNYNQNEPDQPGAFPFTNFGLNWKYGYGSYLTVGPGSVLTVRLSDGGSETASLSGGVYPPDPLTQAYMVNTGTFYERHLPDGSVDVYDQVDTNGNWFMTKQTNAQGNSLFIQYDANFRITTITDYIGQVSTFTYVSNTVGNSGFYKVASIADPFSRSCSFIYDSTNTNLLSITDVINITSKFVYDPSSSFITTMTTPYGTTSFAQYVPGSVSGIPAAGLRITFPDGTTSVLEGWLAEPKLSYYWNREATALYPSDPVNKIYTHCQIMRWVYNTSTAGLGPAPQYMQNPLESSVVNYFYPNQLSQNYRGSLDKPSQITRVLGPLSDIATISGTVTPGDVVSISIQGNGGYTPSYTVVGGDTLTSIAAGLASVINNNASIQSSSRVTAMPSGPAIYLSSDFSGVPGQTINFLPNNGATTEQITLKSAQKQFADFILSGTVNPGEIHAITFFGIGAINYTSVAGDTMSSTAASFASLINANTTLQSHFITATSSGPVIYISAFDWSSLNLAGSNGSYSMTLSPVRNGANQTTEYQYNSIGKVTKSVDPMNRTFSYQYAGNNIDLTQITEMQRGNSRFIGGWTYDSHHRPLTYTDGSGQVTQYTYNSAEQLLTVTDANSNVTTMTYTGNYLTKIDGPLAGSSDSTTFAYDGYGRLSQTTDSEGYTVISSFDNANRLTQTLYPDGSTEQIAYDRLDAVLRKDRIGRWTQDAYDNMQRHAYQIDPLGRKTTYTWCNCGSLAALTDPMGRVTSWHHDLEGRPLTKTFADGSVVNYAYDQVASRLKSKTDALGQKTCYVFNSDDTQNIVGYLNAINPTSSVVYAWDANYKRLASVQKPDWGTYTYTYNNYIAPGGLATTGGGMLSLVHNDVIANSDISYSYDVLGRTTNRSINGASNSITWSYDAMSRITQEANALGNFGYTYVDNTVGSSKGTTRLASIAYPNSQVTNFSWYPNIADQRLQQISNLNPTGGTLSQFNYNYDSAGQITQWQQQQNGGNLFYNLGYDNAGQLTSAQAGSGAPQSPFAKEFYYGYDAASNRTSVQMNSVSTARIGGTKTTGNVLTITAFDPALSGGSKAVSYTVLAADTLATIAQGLATAINNDSVMRGAGITANANGSNTYINIKSASNNITTYTSAVTGTETISFGIFKNALENIVISGSKTTGDIVTITVKDPALAGGQRAITYTTLAGDTLTTIATGVKNAINADAQLTTLGVSATSALAVVSVNSNSTNVTAYSSSVSGSATELIAFSVNQNQNQLATIGGTKTTGDVITLTVYDAALPSGKQAVPYTTLAADTLTTIAAGVAAAVNANTNLQNNGITATSSAAVVTLQSKSPNLTSYRQSFNSTATESMLIAPAKFGWQVVAIGGTKTTGNIVTVTVYDVGLSGGSKAINYTVLAADTLTTIATNLTAAVNADATLTTLGITATASSTVVSLKSLSPNLTTYVTSKSAGATETLALGTGIGVMQSSYNNVNELTSIAAGGSTFFKGDTDKPVSSANLATPVLDVRSSLPTVATSFSARSNRTATETLTIVYTPGQWIWGPMYNLTVGGTVTIGDTLSLTISDVRLQSGFETVSYTTKSGDTTSTIATALSNAIAQNAALAAIITPGINLSGSTFGVGSYTQGNTQPNPFGIVGTVTRAGSESIALTSAADESTTATFTGTVTTGDLLSIVVQNANLTGGQKTIQYTAVGGDTTTTIATAFKNAVNVDTALQAVGVQAISTANVLTLSPYTYYTGSSSGTETVTVSSANRGSAVVTVGGTVTTGNTVTLTSHNPALAGGLKNTTYTVIAGDTLMSISKALADLLNADATLKAVGIKVSNAATLAWSQSFSGSALLPTGSSLASATAVDGSSITKSSTYAMSVNAASGSTLTYDLNGNLLSDGTNSYSWDAENRMIKITYPGSNNFSTFVYDGYGRNISIVETTAGSVTSTKIVCWVSSIRAEERDASGNVTKKFFGRGQMNSATKYFYDLDHLGGVHEMSDNSGTIQAQYSFGPFGSVTKISESVASDFGYAGYYLHSRSGLNLTRTRAYSSVFGRFISRDPIEEKGGVNQYAYVSNTPSQYRDPMGLYARYFPNPPKKCPPKDDGDGHNGGGGNNRGTNAPVAGTSNSQGWDFIPDTTTMWSENPDGTITVKYSNDRTSIVLPDGGHIDIFPDGRVFQYDATGHLVGMLTNPLDAASPPTGVGPPPSSSPPGYTQPFPTLPPPGFR